MIKTVNAGSRGKKQKMPPPPGNQSLISNLFFLATNPTSQLNVGHIPVFEKNDDEDIVLHKRNKRVIVEDEDEVPDEVTIMATIQVNALVAKRYKYSDTFFYQLVESFYKKEANKFARMPKSIIITANKLLRIEMPNITKKTSYKYNHKLCNAI